MARSARSRQTSAGFVITLEFLLVMAVFVLPLLLGMFMLGRKLLTLYLNQREFMEQPYSRAVVWDSSTTAKVIGPVMGYDRFEAPMVIFRDSANQLGVVLSVRPTRLTSAGEVFYSNSDCSGTPRVRAWDTAAATGFNGGVFVGLTSAYPPVGVLYQMFEASYAMGKGNELYRSTIATGTSVTSTTGSPLYVWKSVDITPIDPVAPAPVPPCFLVPDGVTVTNLVTATSVIDFDAVGNYVTPFRLAFPSPNGTLPALPNGEAP